MIQPCLKDLLLLLLLSHFSRVRLCATPQTAAYQAPPSLEFSRQEHWSGLPLPSPMHKSEKWKWSRSVVSDSLRPRGLQPTRLLCGWDFPGKSTGVGCHCLLPLTGLKQHQSVICVSAGLISDVGLTRKSRLHSFLETLGEVLFPCLFQLLETAYIPWFLSPSLQKNWVDSFS